MKKFLYKNIISSFFITFLAYPAVILAAIPFPPMIPFAPGSWWTYVNLVIESIINFIWLMFAAFAVGMFIYAGFLFLNAKGDSSKVKDARNALLWGVVGMFVALLAISIPFIVSGLLGF